MDARNNQEIKIKKAWCKGCGICVAFCPKKVLGLDSMKVKLKCLILRTVSNVVSVSKRCPDFAIF